MSDLDGVYQFQAVRAGVEIKRIMSADCCLNLDKWKLSDTGTGGPGVQEEDKGNQKPPHNCQVSEGQAHGNEIGATIVSSDFECSEWCSSVPRCQGWSRNQGNGHCYLMYAIEQVEDTWVEWNWGTKCETVSFVS